MQKEISLSEEQKYIVDRGMFEYGRAIDNVAFLLSEHLSDVDCSFVDSDIFEKTEHSAEEACARMSCYNTLILRNVLGYEPTEYKFCDYNKKLVYSD